MIINYSQAVVIWGTFLPLDCNTMALKAQFFILEMLIYAKQAAFRAQGPDF